MSPYGENPLSQHGYTLRQESDEDEPVALLDW